MQKLLIFFSWLPTVTQYSSKILQFFPSSLIQKSRSNEWFQTLMDIFCRWLSYSWISGLFELEMFGKFARYFLFNNINFCFVFKTPIFRFWLKYVMYFFSWHPTESQYKLQNSSHRIRSRPVFIFHFEFSFGRMQNFKLDKQQRNNKSAENRKIDCQVTSLKLI